MYKRVVSYLTISGLVYIVKVVYTFSISKYKIV